MVWELVVAISNVLYLWTVSEPTCRLEYEMSMKADIAFLSNKLLIHCRLEFRGNLIPTMKWRTEYGKVLETGITETLRGNVSDQIFTSTIRLPIFAIENGVKICCETSFGETSFRNVSRRSGSTMARNRPDYAHAWMSPTLYTDCEYNFITAYTSHTFFIHCHDVIVDSWFVKYWRFRWSSHFIPSPRIALIVDRLDSLNCTNFIIFLFFIVRSINFISARCIDEKVFIKTNFPKATFEETIFTVTSYREEVTII